jgi:hypothetical protein
LWPESRNPHNLPVHTRKRLKIAAAIAAGLLALGALAPMVYYRLTYHTFAWWQPPPEINYCGRQYVQGSTVTTLATAEWTFTQVMTVYPEGWHVDAKQPRGDTGVVTSVPGLPCTMGLVLEQRNDSYVQYGLSGGP